MRRMIKTLLLSAIATLVFVFTVPAPSSAADVTLVKHKNYYQHHYVPHHHYYHGWDRYPRRYYYYGPSVRGYRYHYPYYDYHHYYHPRGGVRIGPFGIHW